MDSSIASAQSANSLFRYENALLSYGAPHFPVIVDDSIALNPYQRKSAATCPPLVVGETTMTFLVISSSTFFSEMVGQVEFSPMA